MMVHFVTKIVHVPEHNNVDNYKLILPDGCCVATGSLKYVLFEREYWEAVSKQPIQLELNFV